ncbi:MAG: ribosome maturation factor RimP [Actinomycetota bacterium]|nr:ribosome maturation factor RimP [Actinomycetota bacterium]
MAALEEVTDLAAAVARRRRLRLWDVELSGGPRGSVLRVFVDGDDGLDLDTVAQVSEEISRGLDLRDPIPGRYTLEVSSPGLERTLRSREHFELSVGKDAVVKTKTPFVGNSNRIEGRIARVEDASVILSTASEEVEVPFEAIKSARTVFSWK